MCGSGRPPLVESHGVADAGHQREASTRGPSPGRRDRAEPLARPTRTGRPRRLSHAPCHHARSHRRRGAGRRRRRRRRAVPAPRRDWWRSRSRSPASSRTGWPTLDGAPARRRCCSSRAAPATPLPAGCRCGCSPCSAPWSRTGTPPGTSPGSGTCRWDTRWLDMADDYAGLIADEFGGKVDLVVGVSIRRHDRLPPGRPPSRPLRPHRHRRRRVRVVRAGQDARLRLRSADERGQERRGRRADGQEHDARSPGAGWRPRPGRRDGSDDGRGGPPVIRERRHGRGGGGGRVRRAGRSCPPSRCRCCSCAATRTSYFPKEVYEETARLIPDCTLRMYEGVGHAGAIRDRRFPRDVLDFVRQRPAPGLETGGERPAVRGEPVGTAAG